MTDTENRAGGPGRKLGLFAAIALVMGNMIGSGVFLLPASLAPYGWNAVGAWLLTIGGAMVLAFVIAQLTRALPQAGSGTGFVLAAFGPQAAFLIGWAYMVSLLSGNSTIAVAAVSYLSSIVPALTDGAFRPALAALALVWIVALINMRGVRTAGNFQIVTVLLKVLPLILVIGLACVAAFAGKADGEPFALDTISMPSINSAAALTLFALLGFESASLAAGQVKDPERNVPRATLWGTGLTGVLYLLVCSVVALMLPTALAGSSPAPLATFVEHYWSAGPAALLTLFAVISCVGALNGWTLMQGEVPRDMAERGELPRWLARTDANGTPRKAILAGTLVVSVFLLMNASRSTQGLFEYLLLLSTSALLWLYLAIALAALKLGVARPFAAVGALYAIWTLWGAGIEASGLSLVLMLAGLPLWWWTKRSPAT